ncbi:MAG: hypothetical protein AAGF12_15765, partial [Myxococcota bacterium]
PSATVRSGKKKGPLRIGWLLAGAAVLGLGAAGGALLFAEPPPEPDVEAPPPVEPPAPGVAVGSFVLSPPATRTETALRWSSLSEELRPLVALESRDGAFRLVASRIGGDRAIAAAERFGFEAEAAELRSDLLEPRLVQTTASLNVRDAPDVSGTWRRTMPRGTLGVLLQGTVDDESSALGGRGTWGWVVVGPVDEGWSASRFLEAYGGCLPARAQHRELSDRAMISHVVVRTEHAFDAFMAVDPRSDESYLRFYTDAGGCRLTETFALPVRGWTEDVLLPTTEENGGQTLVVVATRSPAPGEERWRVFPYGRTRAVFDRSYRSSQTRSTGRVSVATEVTRGADGAPGYWPLRVRFPDGKEEFYAWNGNTLVAE